MPSTSRSNQRLTDWLRALCVPAVALAAGPLVRQYVVPILTALAISLVLMHRNSTLLFDPQLWAEDVFIYFNQDRLWGASAILMPWNGFKQLCCRLIAFIAGLAPLEFVPRIYASSFIASIFATSAIVYTSPVFRGLAKPIAALAVVGVPVSSEVFFGMCYTQWVLGPTVAIAMIEQSPSRSRAAVLCCAFALVGLSAPFTLIATPLLIWKLYSERTSYAFALILIDILASAFHLQNMVKRVVRYEVPGTFFDRVSSTATIFYRWLSGPVHPGVLSAYLISILTIVAISYYLWKNRSAAARPMLYFASFGYAILLLGCSTANPNDLPNQFGANGRYFYIPIVVFVWAFLYLEQQHTRRGLTFIFTCLALAGLYAAHVERANVQFGENDWVTITACLRIERSCITPSNPSFIGPRMIPTDYQLNTMTILDRKRFTSVP